MAQRGRKPARDRKTQPEALATIALGIADLVELAKDLLPLVFGAPDPVIHLD